ncbi:DNA polymerase III subunit delta' [Aliivibrio sp. S4TY2]|uniref:DNA polymerase III subunit delta' n=1 Tax=unclassified Aliivibrio TaxID=2645654 RepID=UPI00237958EA|nr:MULTISPECIES: DNA polymerase III subunit delta' [unclassified Aliivibrio]MDD9154661.1 DNA polymerase III subunit delta' [Aliivibrio sp. S4TY2]MDD9158976.1 DNA polymerase III subunit delta' [Aliivibrio sp. S4TY1]MDD9162664.1 DNA polymerase III subunit delta' [Aliivibrio sp. S4MY2]MDD9166975.1 DNA polymerase III subunit delta' [Aliivibrio sp. S4MY4]MDD9183741.1 DNA polymerase III subunit delta' [Aliivibrio sp. S4MY3]
MATKLYPWQEDIWHQWQQLIANDRLPHAILCAMPEGTGRDKLVQYFSDTLLCLTQGTEPCGFCHSCDLIQSGNHPDLHWIKPEVEGKSISVEQIRQCNSWALESSQFNAKRMIIIEPAEKMTESAANALLKTLEAPPKNCQFVLLASSLHHLLPTIRSRCQTWQQPVISAEVITQWLLETEELTVNTQSIILNRYLPLAVKSFYQDKKQVSHQQLLSHFSVCVQSSFCNTADVVKTLLKLEDEGLCWLSYLLSDIQKRQLGIVTDWIHCDEKETVERLAKSISSNLIYKQYLSLNALRQQLNDHPGLNKELLLTQWLFEFIGE